jgi:hypothetical protein
MASTISRLSTTPVRKGANPLKGPWLLYGEPGIGKTKIASMMENPYFLATEVGHDWIDFTGDLARTWEDFQQIKNLLFLEKHNFKTVVVDTINNAFDLCCEHMYKLRGIEYMGDLEHGKGYAMVRSDFHNAILELTKGPWNVVLLSHEFLKDSTFRGIKVSRYWPNMMKSARDATLPLCNYIGRLFVDSQRVEGKTVHRRFISFQNRNDWEAKDRSNILARRGSISIDPEEMCWQNVIKAFKENDDAGRVPSATTLSARESNE